MISHKWPFLYERSLGCVGILKEWLIRAVSQVLRAGDTSLSMATIRRRALTAAQCDTILKAIIAGEQQVDLEEERRDHLQETLGLTVQAMPTLPPPPSDADPPPPKRGRGRPGTRKPQRDPVGE